MTLFLPKAERESAQPAERSRRSAPVQTVHRPGSRARFIEADWPASAVGPATRSARSEGPEFLPGEGMTRLELEESSPMIPGLGGPPCPFMGKGHRLQQRGTFPVGQQFGLIVLQSPFIFTETTQ